MHPALALYIWWWSVTWGVADQLMGGGNGGNRSVGG